MVVWEEPGVLATQSQEGEYQVLMWHPCYIVPLFLPAEHHGEGEGDYRKEREVSSAGRGDRLYLSVRHQ